MVTTYDNSFDRNELAVILMLLVGLFIMWRLKKIFSIKHALIYFLFGLFVGILFDHIISVPPFDFYDVNDNSSYEFMDFITYTMYAPYSYIYVYIYSRFKVKPRYTPLYVLAYTLISISSEFVLSQLGVYHYKNGYTIYYSFPIYLLVFSFEILLYKYLNNKNTLQIS